MSLCGSSLLVEDVLGGRHEAALDGGADGSRARPEDGALGCAEGSVGGHGELVAQSEVGRSIRMV